jgi:hypothetical protein
VSSQVCVPKTAPAKVAAAELPSTEMAAGEMSLAEVPATEMHASEMAASEAAEVPATEMHASEMATSEAAEVTETPEMTAAETSEMTASEMTAAETPEMTAAEMTAAAGSTVPKGKSFAHHARHHARRERGFETEPERDRRCENFRLPTSHGGFLPPPCGTMIPSLSRTQPTHGRFRAFHGTLNMA